MFYEKPGDSFFIKNNWGFGLKKFGSFFLLLPISKNQPLFLVSKSKQIVFGG